MGLKFLLLSFIKINKSMQTLVISSVCNDYGDIDLIAINFTQKLTIY